MRHVRMSAVFIALIVAACGGGSASPVSPTVVSTPSPSGAADTSQWTVTQRFVSVTINGPDNCWVVEQRQRLTGATFPDLPMTVTRSAGAIKVEGSFFQVNYAGNFSGGDFTASGGPLEGSTRSCASGSSFQQQPGVSNLSGKFSADDQLMTASEVNVYRLTSGETVTYTWDWQAKRR